MNQRPTPPPSIFVLEPDDHVRPVLKDNLQTWGYEVIMVLDEADAIQRTQRGCERFDLILLSQVGKSIDHLMAIGRQCQGNPDHLAPIVVLAEQYGVDLEGQDILVGEGEYVVYLEDGQQLRNLLHRLCPIEMAIG